MTTIDNLELNADQIEILKQLQEENPYPGIIDDITYLLIELADQSDRKEDILKALSNLNGIRGILKQLS